MWKGFLSCSDGEEDDHSFGSHKDVVGAFDQRNVRHRAQVLIDDERCEVVFEEGQVISGQIHIVEGKESGPRCAGEPRMGLQTFRIGVLSGNVEVCDGQNAPFAQEIVGVCDGRPPIRDHGQRIAECDKVCFLAIRWGPGGRVTFNSLHIFPAVLIDALACLGQQGGGQINKINLGELAELASAGHQLEIGSSSSTQVHPYCFLQLGQRSNQLGSPMEQLAAVGIVIASLMFIEALQTLFVGLALDGAEYHDGQGPHFIQQEDKKAPD